MLNITEPLLQRLPLHLAAERAHPEVTRALLMQPSVDAEAVSGAGTTPLEMVQALQEEHLSYEMEIR